jgi:hypothetical protein
MIQTEHNIGDSYCRIIFNGLEPIVRECTNDPVEEIRYSKDRYSREQCSVTYYTRGRVELFQGMEQKGLFWTKEEAEAYLATLPKNTIFKSDMTLFYVEKTRSGIRLDSTRIEQARFRNGRVYYEIFVRERLFITEEDVGKCVFLTYADAKAYRDELEEALFGTSN